MGKLNGYLPPILISSTLILPRLHDVQTPNRGQHHGICDPPAECRGSMLSGTQPGIWDAVGWWEPHLRSRSDSWVSNQKGTKRIKKDQKGQSSTMLRESPPKQRHCSGPPTGRVMRHKMSAAKKPTITDNCRAMAVQAQKWQADGGLCLNIRQTRERRLHMQSFLHHTASICCNN